MPEPERPGEEAGVLVAGADIIDEKAPPRNIPHIVAKDISFALAPDTNSDIVLAAVEAISRAGFTPELVQALAKATPRRREQIEGIIRDIEASMRPTLA